MRQAALIFDFGNVLCFFDFKKAWGRLGSTLGLTADQFEKKLLDRGYASLLGQFESGQISPEDFAGQIMARGELAIPYAEFVDAWQDIFRLNEPVARVIESLKKAGYPVLLGSNTNVLHSSFYRRQYAATLDLLDHVILSHEVGRMKPHSDFYLACVTAAGLPAAACVFIDDLEENVEGARRAGLTGLLFCDAPGLMVALRQLGIDLDHA